MNPACRVDHDTRIAVIFRPKGVAQHGGALVAQIILAAIAGRVPGAAFEKDYAQAGSGQLLGHDAARGARADHYRVHRLHEGEPFLGLSWARPSTCGSSRPNMRQLTASRLPP